MSTMRVDDHGMPTNGCTVGYLLPTCMVWLSILFVVSHHTFVGDGIPKIDVMSFLE